MEVSLYLAKVFGIFFLIGGLGLVLNHKKYLKLDMQLLRKDQPTVFILGMIMLLAGLFMVVKHNVWELSHVGLITLIGWIVVIKGAVIILIPDLMDVFKKKTFGDHWYLVGGIIWLLAGACLTYYGYFV